MFERSFNMEMLTPLGIAEWIGTLGDIRGFLDNRTGFEGILVVCQL